MRDAVNYIKELCDFIDENKKLILENHAEMLSINHIYEKTIFYHKEITQLLKFLKEKLEITDLNFDEEENRMIELVVR